MNKVLVMMSVASSKPHRFALGKVMAKNGVVINLVIVRHFLAQVTLCPSRQVRFGDIVDFEFVQPKKLPDGHTVQIAQNGSQSGSFVRKYLQQSRFVVALYKVDLGVWTRFPKRVEDMAVDKANPADNIPFTGIDRVLAEFGQIKKIADNGDDIRLTAFGGVDKHPEKECVHLNVVKVGNRKDRLEP